MSNRKELIDNLEHLEKLPRSCEIGIEIEMEGQNLQFLEHDHPTWRVEHDGSLRGAETLEYVLKKPVEIGKVPKVLQVLMENKNQKFIPSDRCGVHVHINVQRMIFSEIMSFIILYMIWEKVLVNYCGESREGNMFCLRANDAQHIIIRLIELQQAQNLNPILKRHREDRYSALNLCSLHKFGSLEFRALKTPEDLLKIEDWVQILYRLKEKSLECKNPMDYFNEYSYMGTEGFLLNTFGPDISKHLENTPNLKIKLLDGIRLAQNIAFTPPDKKVYDEWNRPEENIKGAWPGNPLPAPPPRLDEQVARKII